MNSDVKFPVYAKWTYLLIGLSVFFGILYITRGIILPLIYAIIIAVVISPVVNYLESKKVNRGIAIAVVLVIVLGLIATLIYFIFSQASLLVEAAPMLSAKLKELLHQVALWASDNFNVSVKQVNAWFAEEKSNFFDSGNLGLGSTLVTLGSVLATIFLTPVYIFMILFYQPHLLLFIHKVFGSENDKQVNEILGETKVIIQGYLVGLFLEFVIIAVLNSVGLLILGIQYAILLGMVGAILNIIPYVGGLIGVLLFMMIALLTKEPVYVLYVMTLYLFIQFVDNNFIVPKIVGSKVKLNALISILAVISGGALWGIPGMFLSIPLMAIVKLIADRIGPLKPWGYLLGDDMPTIMELKIRRRKTAKA